jgi:hypothetical protein
MDNRVSHRFQLAIRVLSTVPVIFSILFLPVVPVEIPSSRCMHHTNFSLIDLMEIPSSQWRFVAPTAERISPALVVAIVCCVIINVVLQMFTRYRTTR